MSELDTRALRDAVARLCGKLEAVADELNSADGKLGDGDLGVTLQRGARGLREVADALPDDLGMALTRCAQAFTKVSGSSYGTLLASGMMSAAKACKGRAAVPWGEVSALLGGALDAMLKRGRGQLGEKTVLDALEAARAASAGLDRPDALLAAIDEAVQGALDQFRERQSRQGRARMFGEKSIGLDDPGMLALKRIVEGLRGR